MDAFIICSYYVRNVQELSSKFYTKLLNIILNFIYIYIYGSYRAVNTSDFYRTTNQLMLYRELITVFDPYRTETRSKMQNW